MTSCTSYGTLAESGTSRSSARSSSVTTSGSESSCGASTGGSGQSSATHKLMIDIDSQQRQIIVDAGRIVVEGRDIGTVVAPDADLKVYLTASVDERARRRSGETMVDVDATAADLRRRDQFDSTRAADPLRRAADAVELDTTRLGIDEVVSRLRELLGVRA